MFIGRKSAAAAILTLSLASASVVCLPLAAVVLTATDSQAEVRYVRPQSEAAVRRGQGNEYKILALVKEGVAVELLEENESYSRVRLENGVEGWILRRFLSVEPPPTELVDVLRKQKEELQQREMAASQKAEDMVALLAKSKSELDALVAERDKLRTDYQTLQHDTADVMKIQRDREQTEAENKKLVEKNVVLEKENGEMKKNRNINWFLAGAGVLLFGVLLGRMPSPNRRRKQSLLS